MITKAEAVQMVGTMELLSDLTDDELFQTLSQIVDELQARVSARKLLGRISPEQLGLFPAGLLNRLVVTDKVWSIDSACQHVGWLERQTVYNGVRSAANPLPHFKIADRHLFLAHWLDGWRSGVRHGRPKSGE